MKKENLVILKGNVEVSFKTDILSPNKYYRCIPISENGRTEYLVYGIVFDEKKYAKLFELAQERVLRDFKALGMLKEGNLPISKSLFTSIADIHTYGHGKGKMNVWYFRTTRDTIYGFYPMQGNKKEQQAECYGYYLDMLGGDVECLDNQDVQFGNCGIPLSYGKLRVI